MVIVDSETMANTQAKIERLEEEKLALQNRLTNLRAYLQGELSMGGGYLEKIEERPMPVYERVKD